MVQPQTETNQPDGDLDPHDHAERHEELHLCSPVSYEADLRPLTRVISVRPQNGSLLFRRDFQ